MVLQKKNICTQYTYRYTVYLPTYGQGRNQDFFRKGEVRNMNNVILVNPELKFCHLVINKIKRIIQLHVHQSRHHLFLFNDVFIQNLIF